MSKSRSDNHSNIRLDGSDTYLAWLSLMNAEFAILNGDVDLALKRQRELKSELGWNFIEDRDDEETRLEDMKRFVSKMEQDLKARRTRQGPPF